MTDPTPVDPPVDPPVEETPAPGLTMPTGPDLGDLQAFTDAIPDEGHRAIAQQLVDAFTIRDAQLAAFIGAYTSVLDTITASQDAITTLQAQVLALQPAPTPDPVPDPVPGPVMP